MITRVYERHDTPTSIAAREVTFLQYSEDSPEALCVDQRIALDRDDYATLGEPEQITVTIWAGDGKR